MTTWRWGRSKRSRRGGLNVQVIGFDALPEALAAVFGTLAGTVEQFPGGQSRKAMQIMVELLKDQKQPEE